LWREVGVRHIIQGTSGPGVCLWREVGVRHIIQGTSGPGVCLWREVGVRHIIQGTSGPGVCLWREVGVRHIIQGLLRGTSKLSIYSIRTSCVLTFLPFLTLPFDKRWRRSMGIICVLTTISPFKIGLCNNSMFGSQNGFTSLCLFQMIRGFSPSKNISIPDQMPQMGRGLLLSGMPGPPSLDPFGQVPHILLWDAALLDPAFK
jgi:hypothetical protein